MLFRSGAVPAGLEVRVTAGALEQALDNLLSNAIEVAPPGTAVHCTASAAEPGHVLLTVRDEGPGMAPEQLERAFDRFWRPAGATRGGSGLGLTIARELLLAHGGDLSLIETGESGTRFRLAIPDRPAP